MAFSHSKNAKVYVNGYDLSSYLNTISTPAAADVAETSTFTKSSKTYVAGKKDATVDATGFFDGDSDAVDEVLEAALATQVDWVWYPAGDTFGNVGFGVQAVDNAYNVAAANTSAVSIAAGGQVTDGKDTGVSLHALSQVTTTGNSSGHDGGAQSTDGGVAYLQVTDVTGTVALSLYHDSNSDFSTESELVAFTNIDTDYSTEKVEFSGTVERYIRAKWTLDEEETLTFNVLFCRY